MTQQRKEYKLIMAIKYASNPSNPALTRHPSLKQYYQHNKAAIDRFIKQRQQDNDQTLVQWQNGIITLKQWLDSEITGVSA